MKDLQGFSFTVGCKVARAVLSGKSPLIDICEVTKIEDGKLYLDDSKQAIRFPNRLLIIEHEPVLHMMERYERSKQ